MNERLTQLTGRFTGEIGMALFPIEIVHIQNLERAREHLKNGSLLVYANHFDRFDTLVYGKALKYYFPLDHLSVLTALKYMDPNRNKEHKMAGLVLRLLSSGYGFQRLRVVQDLDEEKKQYPNFNEINRKTFLQTVRLLKTPGNIVIIAPEGTRSNDGGLLEGKESFETLLKTGGEKVLALPLAAVPPIRSLHRTRVFVGQPFTYAEIKSESEREGKSVTELAMLRIANLLPEQNRGFYRQI